MRREYAEDGHLSRTTAGVVYAAYGLQALGWLGAVRACALPPPLSGSVGVSIGLPLTLSGAGLFVTGWRALLTADDSGLATGGLITTGVYRVSRNPQNVGWVLLLTGGALARRSGMGLGLDALFWMAFRTYVPWRRRFWNGRTAKATAVTAPARPAFSAGRPVTPEVHVLPCPARGARP